MNSRIIGTIIVAGLAISACGGGSGGDRGEAVDQFVDAMKEQDAEVDRDCAEKVADKLSDDDVKAIIDGSNGADAELSPAGEEIALELLDCVDMSSIFTDEVIDQVIAGAGDNVDADCMRKALKEIDLSSVDDPAVATAMIECVDFDG